MSWTIWKSRGGAPGTWQRATQKVYRTEQRAEEAKRIFQSSFPDRVFIIRDDLVKPNIRS